MSDFDPGPGWREVTEREWLSTPIDADHLELASNGKIRHWVREVPVPALPTAPYTVIRVTWIDSADEGMPILWVRGDEQWAAVEEDQYATIDWFRRSITGFEVLSEPRAVTAKAVLDRVRATGLYELLMVANPDNGADLDKIAREFGVES